MFGLNSPYTDTATIMVFSSLFLLLLVILQRNTFRLTPLRDTTRCTLRNKKLSSLVLAFLMTATGVIVTACGGGGGGAGGGGGEAAAANPAAPIKKLTAEWTYDLSAVSNLSGFKFYKQTTNANNEQSYDLILDTKDVSSFKLTDYPGAGTLMLQLAIPVNEIPNYSITTPITLVMTAYDSDKLESDYSNAYTVQ